MPETEGTDNEDSVTALHSVCQILKEVSRGILLLIEATETLLCPTYLYETHMPYYITKVNTFYILDHCKLLADTIA